MIARRARAAAAARPPHPPRPGDDRPQGDGQGARRPVRHGRRAGRRAASGSSRTGRSGRGRVTPSSSSGGGASATPGWPRPNIAAAVLTTVLAIVSTVAAWTFRDQLRPDRAGRSRSSVRTRRRPSAKQLGSTDRSKAQAARPAVQPADRTAVRQPGGPRARRRRSPGELQAACRAARPLRDEAIACLALPDLKPTGRVIHRPPGVIRGRLRPHHDPLCTAVPRRDDPGPPRRRRPGGRPLPGPGRSRRLCLRLQPRRPLPGDHASPGYALTVWDIDRRAASL